MKTKLLFILLSAGIIFTKVNCYKFKHLSPEERINRIVEYLKEELELSDEQYQLLLTIKEKSIKRHKEIKKDPYWFKDDFLNQLESGNIDIEKIKKEIKDFHQSLLENRLKDIDDVEPFIKSLNPEQRKKLVQLIKEQKNHFRKYHHKFSM